MKILLLTILVLFVGCVPATSSDPTTPTANGLQCSDVPAGSTVAGPLPVCTSPSGTWTQYTYDSSTNQYYQFCGGSDADHYADQASFDASEGTSTVPSISITSNNDYVVASDCASGSILYDDGSGVKTFMYIWKKSP